MLKKHGRGVRQREQGGGKDGGGRETKDITTESGQPADQESGSDGKDRMLEEGTSSEEKDLSEGVVSVSVIA